MMSSRFAKPAVLLAAIGCAAFSFAGFDGWFVVSKVTGKAQARQFVGSHGRKIWTPWHDLHVGDVINPPSEVVTFNKSSLWIQSGNRVQNPSKMRLDERVNTTELGPNTLITTHAASQKGPRILVVVHGHTRLSSEHGNLPAYKSPGTQ